MGRTRVMASDVYEIFKNNTCMKNVTGKSEITYVTGGVSGAVFSVTPRGDRRSGHFYLKVLAHINKENLRQAENELEYYLSAYRWGIAPKISCMMVEYTDLPVTKTRKSAGKELTYLTTNCHAAMVMSYAGRTAQRYFENYQISEEAKLQALDTIFELVEFMNFKCNILHGDFHWANITLLPVADDERLRVHVIDFGWSMPYNVGGVTEFQTHHKIISWDLFRLLDSVSKMKHWSGTLKRKVSQKIKDKLSVPVDKQLEKADKLARDYRALLTGYNNRKFSH